MGFGTLFQKKKYGILVVRVGTRTVDFVFFAQDSKTTEILSWGSEDMARMNARQALENIFLHLPNKESLQELVVTFGANAFRARLIELSIPPGSNSHRVDRQEAFGIEREAKVRATREIQKLIFQESGIVPSEFTLRRVRILERRIAGYRVPRLEGFQKRPIELSVLGMFLLEDAFEPIDHFARAHKIRNLRVLHIAEALATVTKPPAKEGVYLYLEEEKTHVALRQGERFLLPGTIAMGDDHFQEFFANLLGTSRSTAAIMQNRYFEGNLSQETMEKFTAFALPETQKFAMLVKAKLQELKTTLPSAVWLFGKVGALACIQGLFNGDVLRELPFAQEPKAEFLLPRDILECAKGSLATDPLYTSLCLLGISFIQSFCPHEKTPHRH